MATMLTASSSPRLSPHGHQTDSVSGFLSPNLRRENLGHIANSKSASPIVKPHSTHVSAYPPPYSPQPPIPPQAQSSPSQARPTTSASLVRPRCPSPTEQRSHPPSVRSISTQTSPSPIRTISHPSAFTSRSDVLMVDAQTQYSPPLTSQTFGPPSLAIEQGSSTRAAPSSLTQTQTQASTLASLHVSRPVFTFAHQSLTRSLSSASTASNELPYEPVTHAAMSTAPPGLNTSSSLEKQEKGQDTIVQGVSHMSQPAFKRHHSTTNSDPQSDSHASQQNGDSRDVDLSTPRTDSSTAPSKKHRPADPEMRTMPLRYETCDTRDLVVLISSMLMELIRYNDTIPLSSGSDSSSTNSNLTRFHSRAPPGISVADYLQRLTTYATLSPPILLSMVYYIDRLASFYPAFTISSLTVHRFLITAATVASKGLSDSFWTNKTYARVGGVSVRELALLELEFLVRVQWRIVPRPETLIDYYKSLVERNVDYCMEEEEGSGAATEQEDGGSTAD